MSPRSFDVKAALQRAVHRTGFELHRAGWQPDDRALYEQVYGRDAVRERRFYNIGAGRFSHPCWTNVDHPSEWYATDQGAQIGIAWDLLEIAPLPIDTATAHLIYTSHTVEHVTDEAVRNLFAEARRVLRPGGILRVTTPDIDLSHRAYRAGDRHFWYWADAHSPEGEWQRLKHTSPMNTWSIQQLFLYDFATNASTMHADGAPERIDDDELDRIFAELPYEEALDHCIRRCSLDVHRRNPQDHINWHRWPKMERLLREAGFADVRRSGYLQSHSPVLRERHWFDTRFPPISLYVEATR